MCASAGLSADRERRYPIHAQQLAARGRIRVVRTLPRLRTCLTWMERWRHRVPDIADPKISLPTIARVALANFDLYSNEPNACEDIERPVFCLIGANGLGKS